MNTARPTRSWHRAAIIGLLSAAYGAWIWAVSPALTGEQEPWDASLGLYALAVAAGGLLAFIHPRSFWAAPVGLVVGQFIYMVAALPLSNLGPLALIPLITLAVPSAVVAGIIRFAFRRAEADAPA